MQNRFGKEHSIRHGRRSAILPWVLFLILALGTAGSLAAGTLALPSPEPQVAPAADPMPDPRRRHSIGYGRLTSNDLIGDGHDRWRSGSVTSSRVYGYDWIGAAPYQFGELLELRLQGQIISPRDLRIANPADRPWAGALSIGLHSHMQRGPAELSLGADLVVIGPQTGLDSFQDRLHDLIGAPRPSAAVLAAQIPNSIRPTLVAEIGRSFDLSPTVALRPFVEARAGDETLLRIGADLTFGPIGRGELLVRESISGQRYRAVYGAAPGYSLVLGGDIAHVASSVYLPSSRGYVLTSHRDRARLGLHWQGKQASVFYGLTYLGREFVGQNDSQVIGSIRSSCGSDPTVLRLFDFCALSTGVFLLSLKP